MSATPAPDPCPSAPIPCPSAPRFQVLARDCVSRPTLEHITGRWGGLTLLGLREGPLRFSELRRRVDGIAEKALAQTLRTLERDGFVHRDPGEGYPSRVEYSLTGLGASTATLLHALAEHVESRMPDVLAAQAAYDRTHPPRS
ncbi:winged helix-turn-helix transcriptional regulator [Marinitenerispora sediminis]|uniref:Transcriptional regulator n=1 Tax=Marinitenerispora sediminis TaxID=1931232 RepID=A0A368T162_9ACTN|nr:helix-turn-helix domain-containing protein [Marinitenerispora sediminis]RCV52547.1 transcriptional regulator [Marinitenerispora sediminis]RCV53777.1 transcriptional regulator [Marinitenerispora sediminis]RCV59613.1 transcriptional regulator [Marinitenerispora sediminis]